MSTGRANGPPVRRPSSGASHRSCHRRAPPPSSPAIATSGVLACARSFRAGGARCAGVPGPQSCRTARSTTSSCGRTSVSSTARYSPTSVLITAPCERGFPSGRPSDMSTTVRGVVSLAKGEPVEIRDVVVPDPGPGEARVRVQACGVCHTDLHYREGAINDEFPFLLGHEAAGKVEAVGPDAANLAPGDFVVLAWRAPCGQCRSCRRGRPWYCFDSRNASQRMTLEDGTPLTAAIGIGAFAEVCLVAAGQAVKVDPAARPEAAGLVGCGIMAGFGAIVNTAKVERGDTVAVFGCGGVGNAAIHAAALVGARKVIAVDIDRRKLALAGELGATDLVDSSQ